MSVFGDGTPDEEILNELQYIRDKHNLTFVRLIEILGRVIEWLADTENWRQNGQNN